MSAKDLAKKNRLVISLLVAGLGLIGLSLYFSFFNSSTSLSESPLAYVTRETGRAFVLKRGLAGKEAIERRLSLYDFNSVETNDTGEAVLSFDSGFKIRMFNNALVTLEKIKDQKRFHILVIVRSGEVRVDGFGQEGDLFISKNGERISASDYNGSLLARTPTIAPDPEDFEAPPAPTDQGLSEEEIAAGIQRHRTSFFKCYTQLLQREPTAKGKASLSFTIENNGKMSLAEVTASEIKNSDFKKCLLEVLRRVEFRSFKGPAISTLFPLKFE